MKAYVVFTRYNFRNKQTGELEVTETCTVVDKITRTIMKEASVIIDFSHNRLEKNREPEVTIEQYLEHFQKRYPKQFNGLIQLIEAENKYLSDVNDLLDTLMAEQDERDKSGTVSETGEVQELATESVSDTTE